MRFTVDTAKKKEFINIFLLMPESSILNAMRQAKFTKEDIADLRMQRFLQRALPGGLIKGLRAYIAWNFHPGESSILTTTLLPAKGVWGMM